MKLAVIPARGGSKRIPGKNIKPFGGKPIIAWSVEAARESGCFDRIIVSTDDEEIASVARKFGAEVPFVRPSELSDDHTGTVPVIAHAVEWQNSQGDTVEVACCIYATAPFVRAADIRRGLDILHETRADVALSVTEYAAPIQRAFRITGEGRIEMFDQSQFEKRSQDLDTAWHDAGQFYWARASVWLEQRPLFGPHAAPVELPRYRVQDIDTPDDWKRAELLYKASELQPD